MYRLHCDVTLTFTLARFHGEQVLDSVQCAVVVDGEDVVVTGRAGDGVQLVEHVLAAHAHREHVHAGGAQQPRVTRRQLPIVRLAVSDHHSHLHHAGAHLLVVTSCI